MLIRRISEHLKEQNWFAVWLDVFVVFLGVFIGLQADNWNETRIAKAEAKIYYERLIEDLRAEEITQLAHIAYYQSTKRHGEAALRALQQHDGLLGGEFLIDIYQATQIWNYRIQRATYDKILSGSIADAIPDASVRRQLANYYVGLEGSEIAQQERTPFRDNLRAYLPHAVQNSVRANCGDRYEFDSNHVVWLSLPQNCDLTFEPMAISEAVNALKSYADLEKELTRHLADIESKLVTLEFTLFQTREIVSHLEGISG